MRTHLLCQGEHMTDEIRTEFWGHQLDALITEIVREASICQVRLLEPGVVDAVLHDNASVCGHDNPAAFKKLRELMMMTFVVRGKAFDKLGPLEADGSSEAWTVTFFSPSANANVSINTFRAGLNCWAQPGSAGRLPDLKALAGILERA